MASAGGLAENERLSKERLAEVELYFTGHKLEESDVLFCIGQVENIAIVRVLLHAAKKGL